MSTLPIVTVALVDDHNSYRQTLATCIARDAPDLKVIAEGSTGQAAIDIAIEHQPQVLVLDLQMPKIHGTEAIDIIKRRSPDTKIMVLTGHTDVAYLRLTLKSGADGYLLKEDDFFFILTSIRLTAEDYRPISPRVTHLILENTTFVDDNENTLEALTEEERQVLRMTIEEQSRQAIADQLNITRHKVSKIRERLRAKVGHKDLARFATEHWWLE